MVNRFCNENCKKLKILAFLFKECDNNCDFCFQKTYSNIPSVDFFTKNIDKYVNIFGKCLSDISKFDDITINLMGGELFFDNQIENPLIHLLDSFSSYQNLKVRLTSNLINPSFDMIMNVISFLNKKNIQIEFFTSFDFGGIRFKSKENFNKFTNNVENLLSITNSFNIRTGIETIRTRHMLNAYETENDEFLFIKNISEKVLISQNEIIGNFDYSLSADESIKLWKLVLKKTPNISDLKSHFFESGRNCLNISRRTIIGDSIFNGCRSQKYGIFETENKKSDISSMTDHYGCLTCKYCDRCSMKCPIEQKYDKCDKKEVFEYILKS